LVENRDFFILPFVFDAPVGGPRWNIAVTFGVEKLERCAYPTVKKFEDMFIRFDTLPACDKRTEFDGRTDRRIATA